MPRKNKCIHKARKAELVFLERPREGPVHSYETLLPSADNPRYVPTKPIDQDTSAAWVCPQFETKSVVLKACQKQHHHPHKPQNQDVNPSLLRSGGACRRATACKFPALTFEDSEGYAVHLLDCPNFSRKNIQHFCSHPEKGTAAKGNIQDNSREITLPAPQPVESQVFSLQDVETPPVPSVRNWRCGSTLPQESSHAWHPEKELSFGIDPCETGESAAILVTDTPEREYGVKVTWRRRPHIMKYLWERG
ncbi:RAD9, HUS1, RAD1-interacting nuclear orphan protein 1, partial [Colius striatus]